MNNLKRYEEITRKKFIGNDYSIEKFQNSKAVSNLIKEIDKLKKENKGLKKKHSMLIFDFTSDTYEELEQLKKENKNLKDNKNEALRYISNYLALDQRYKWDDNVDEKLKLVKKILNGREKTITNISYENLLRQNKQLQNNRDKAIEKLVIKQLRYLNEPHYKLTILDLEEIKNILKR